MFDEMEACARKKDNRGFYKALLSFIDVGISSTKNPVLLQVLESIMPNLRRFQYIAIMLKNESITENCKYFETIIEALEERKPEKGVRAIKAYIRNEKEYTIDLVKSSPLSSYLDSSTDSGHLENKGVGKK